MKTISQVFLAAMLLVGESSVGLAACPDENDLKSQYQDLSLEMSQIGFKIAQLGLPLTHPTIIGFEAKYARLSRARSEVKQALNECQSR